MQVVSWFALAAVLLLAGCDDGSKPASSRPVASLDAGKEELPWFGRTRGSAVVLSRDERIAVVTNRSAGVVTVFELDPERPLEQLVRGRTEIDLGAGSDPWAAVISGEGETAYVITRRDQRVTRISDLRGEPTMDGTVTVGSEPTAIALAPSGSRLYVANWGEGTISVVTTRDPVTMRADFKETGKISLNEALVGTGVLGEVEPRLGLAHPRALVITDDGDEDDRDETLYATEFFSMPLLDAGSPDEPGYFDRNRQGFVYRYSFANRGVLEEPIAIAPISDTGIVDQKGAPTGCFPNQLYAAATDGKRLLVTSMCASPAGPLGPAQAPDPPNPANFKTVIHPAVFVIDTETNRELPARRVLLSYELDQRFDADGAVARRIPLIPNDIAFTARGDGDDGARTSCLTAMGTNAVFCVHQDAEGDLLDIGSKDRRYIDLAPRGQSASHLPVGIAISARRGFALVANDNTDTLAVLDLEAGAVRKREDPVMYARAGTRESDVANGRNVFVTGLGVWSHSGAARVSCEGCHPDGLSDGVTWSFHRGPRRTPSTAGTYYGDGERRLLLWTASVDEVHDVEGIVRGVAGGVGAITWRYAVGRSAPSNAFRIVYDGSPPDANTGRPTSILRHNLNGAVKDLIVTQPSQHCDEASATCDQTPVTAWNQIDAYIKSVRAPRAPSGLDPVQVERGAELFRMGRCASCHGGRGWTLSRMFYTPGVANNGALPYARPTEVTDEQLGLLRTERYLVPEQWRALNPPGVSGSATFRRWAPDRDRVVYLYGTMAGDGYASAVTHMNDQINCALRAVGTFPDQSAGDNEQGIVPAGSPIVVREVRHNSSVENRVLALGATGFNIPPLVGMATAGSYFHAGNARTLEESFDMAFAGHFQALVPGFLAEGSKDRDARVRELVAYLLSIDDDTQSESPLPGDDLCVPTAAIK